MRNTKPILMSAISVATLLWGSAAFGQDQNAADFVSKATIAGKTEVILARIALKNSQADDVHTFAKQMIKDHSAANVQLASIAKSKNLPVPTHIDGKHRAVVDSLRTQTGAAFDAAYAKQMVADHVEAVALFKSAAASSMDSDLSAFAQKTLATLEQHKSMADALAAQHSSGAQ
jgi:putative membrane protein